MKQEAENRLERLRKKLLWNIWNWYALDEKDTFFGKPLEDFSTYELQELLLELRNSPKEKR